LPPTTGGEREREMQILVGGGRSRGGKQKFSGGLLREVTQQLTVDPDRLGAWVLLLASSQRPPRVYGRRLAFFLISPPTSLIIYEVGSG
jgi:hypothetical protein